MIIIIDIILILVIIGMFVYPRWNLRRNAKVIDEPEFTRLIATSQLIDIREANQFRVNHILGARNLPSGQIDQSLNAISKHKPVLMYETSRPVAAAKVAKKLKKAGVPEIYLLKGGLNAWTGKTKSGN
ncbi:MAG: rhodanese-like domain-containing protein [Streptococcaceae bacterium]|nr:rhodanese-like domain-containing protein [Lactococcus protaetiae]MCL2114161.1 rhodanese-like domain-containing protein [Streptococcaceae bacterium]